jgi:uncharacterized glyoxalase superfamily protein PhnB
MIGETRNPDEPSLLAAALDSVAGRLKGLLYGLHGAVQARLNLPWRAPRGGIAGAPVIPTVRYRNVPAAIQWLCRAFGMQVHRVVNDPSGVPCYAELTIGSGMLIVAPIEETPLGKLMVQPDEIGGVETQVCYLCVANARAHYARAMAAGAAIVLDLEDELNRGRAYSCRDPEGHVWNFGTYDPWEKQQRTHRIPGRGARYARHGLAAALLLALALVLMSEVVPQPGARAGTAVVGSETRQALVTDEPKLETNGQSAKEAAERETQAQHAALKAAERAAAEARVQLAEARGALEKAERETATARAQLDETRRAKQSAERTAAEAREHLAAAQRAADRARQEAALERGRRLAAAMRARRATRAYSAPAQPRTWCYNASAPPSASARGRLTGFCRT